jgi:hypothetical protein
MNPVRLLIFSICYFYLEEEEDDPMKGTESERTPLSHAHTIILFSLSF